MAYEIYQFKKLTSTQDKAKEFAKKGLSNIVVVSGTQTKGRGRFKRKWHSSKNGLWMSILLKPKNTENMQYLTFIAAIAVVKSIKKIANLKTSIKWPNDVHFNGKKLCGILTEGDFGKENFAAIGIGLNVNQKKFSKEISDTATSLRMIDGRKFDKKILMKKIVDEFFYLYVHYYNEGKLREIIKLWKSRCDTIGKNVHVISKTNELIGKAVGIEHDCSLLVKLKNGRVIKIIEGDINVMWDL